MDVAPFKLREMAALRWGDTLSPHFDAILNRIEDAIADLPVVEDAAPGPT